MSQATSEAPTPSSDRYTAEYERSSQEFRIIDLGQLEFDYDSQGNPSNPRLIK